MLPKKISVIVFDLGNVLLPFDYKIAINKLNVIGARLGEKFINFYQNNYQLHRSFEKGKLSEVDFINKILKVLNNKITAEEFCEIYSGVFTENKENNNKNNGGFGQSSNNPYVFQLGHRNAIAVCIRERIHLHVRRCRPNSKLPPILIHSCLCRKCDERIF